MNKINETLKTVKHPSMKMIKEISKLVNDAVKISDIDEYLTAKYEITVSEMHKNYIKKHVDVDNITNDDVSYIIHSIEILSKNHILKIAEELQTNKEDCNICYDSVGNASKLLTKMKSKKCKCKTHLCTGCIQKIKLCPFCREKYL